MTELLVAATVVLVLIWWSPAFQLRWVAGRYKLQRKGNVLTTDRCEIEVHPRCIDYRAHLADAPEELTLTREGAGTGQRAAAGERELTLGDPDFDDVLWVEPVPEDAAIRTFLHPGRREGLLRAFLDLPEAEVRHRDFLGERGYSPFGLRSVVRHCVRLAREGDAPVKRAQPGWFNRSQRRRQSLGLFFVGIAFMLVGALLDDAYRMRSRDYFLSFATAWAFLPWGLGVAFWISLPGTVVVTRLLVRLLMLGCLGASLLCFFGLPDDANALLRYALAGAFLTPLGLLQHWWYALGRVRVGWRR